MPRVNSGERMFSTEQVERCRFAAVEMQSKAQSPRSKVGAGEDFYDCIPREHDTGWGRGRVGEFFEKRPKAKG
jgi:hypothetical protein